MAHGLPNPTVFTKEEQELMDLYEEVCKKRSQILQKYCNKRMKELRG